MYTISFYKYQIPANSSNMDHVQKFVKQLSEVSDFSWISNVNHAMDSVCVNKASAVLRYWI